MQGTAVLRRPPCLRERSTADLRALLDGWDSLTEDEMADVLRFVCEREICERHDAYYLRFNHGHTTDPNGQVVPAQKLVRTRVVD